MLLLSEPEGWTEMKAYESDGSCIGRGSIEQRRAKRDPVDLEASVRLCLEPEAAMVSCLRIVTGVN